MTLRELFERGLALHRSGALDQAEPVYRAVLRAEPSNVPALHMLGYLLGQRQQYDEAIALLQRAAAIRPDIVPVQSHLGHALLAAGRRTEAVAAYEQVLARDPDAVEVLYNHAVTLSELERAHDALPAIERALALSPDTAMLHYTLGVIRGQLRQPDAALAAYDRALALDPGLALAHGNRAMAALNACAFDRIAGIAAELRTQVATGTPIAPLTLQGYSDDKALLQRAAQNSIRAQIPQIPEPLWRGETYAHDRIRLAYVSYDFRDHAVAHQIAPLIARHDRTRFQVIAISTGPDDGSETRTRIAGAFDQFHDQAGQPAAAIAQQMRALEIDIAIDLGGHTGGAPLAVFAHRPAPIQVSWLGYPGTTGAPFMDYLIADAIVAPACDQRFFDEKLMHLPDTYFPTDPDLVVGPPPRRADLGLPDKGFVFCCFNHAWKITPDVFAVWMRLLHAVPGSVLWLKDGPAADNLRHAAQAQGIEPQRLVFAGEASLPAYLARLAVADLFLDTLPYNAHATAAHALFAGVAVLTCKCEAFASRVGASLLAAARVPELITESLAAYEAMAVALAREPQQLQALRAKLIQARESAPLFDPDRFRRALEAAYLAMTPLSAR